jgi:GT2 family glycosyltransferase
MADPAVSVILPAFESHETIAACLESLRGQTFRDFEVIVVDSSPDGRTERIVAERFPEVRLIRSPNQLTAHAARNLASAKARGRILVFSDPDCRMSPRWLERLVEAQRAGHAAAGGSVDSLGTRWLETGIHWCKYPWWMSAGPRGTRPELPSANVSYSRELFLRIGPFPEAWCGDTVLSRRVAKLGIPLWFEPEARVFHDHRAGWRSFLRERYHRGMDFGWERPRLEQWRRPRTLAYALAAPALLVWKLVQSTRYLAPGRWADWLWHLPVIMAGYAARQLGETWGYWRALWRK